MITKNQLKIEIQLIGYSPTRWDIDQIVKNYSDLLEKGLVSVAINNHYRNLSKYIKFGAMFGASKEKLSKYLNN